MARIPTLRLDQVLKKLLKFNITSRDGKGSELVLEGKKQNSEDFFRYRVGRHSGNREVPPFLLKAILRRFDITEKEFFDDVCH